MTSVTYLLLARIPSVGLPSFEEYESRVLPLLSAHGGRLVRRLGSADRRVEVHLVEFSSPDAYAAYRDDPRRDEHGHLLEASGAATELFELYDLS